MSVVSAEKRPLVLRIVNSSLNRGWPAVSWIQIPSQQDTSYCNDTKCWFEIKKFIIEGISAHFSWLYEWPLHCRTGLEPTTHWPTPVYLEEGFLSWFLYHRTWVWRASSADSKAKCKPFLPGYGPEPRLFHRVNFVIEKHLWNNLRDGFHAGHSVSDSRWTNELLRFQAVDRSFWWLDASYQPRSCMRYLKDGWSLIGLLNYNYECLICIPHERRKTTIPSFGLVRWDASKDFSTRLHLKTFVDV